jgi:lactate dehydrogenase-like 2-hydroxyacid dehydrogenase
VRAPRRARSSGLSRHEPAVSGHAVDSGARHPHAGRYGRGNPAGPRLSYRELKSELVHGYDAALVQLDDRIDRELIEAAAPALRGISVYATGYDNVDLEAAARRGLTVGHTPGALTAATADLTMAPILAATRRVTEADPTYGTGSSPAGLWTSCSATTSAEKSSASPGSAASHRR